MSASGKGWVLGTCALAGPVIFTAAWLVSWPLQEQYSPRREDISALAALDAQYPGIMMAPLVLARGFGKDPHWRDLRTYSLLSGVLTLALLVLYGTGAVDGWNGLVQRVFVTVPWIWIAVLGLRLRRLAPLRASE